MLSPWVLRVIDTPVCRESGDHGPFNSWDRQVYVTDVRTGEPDTQKEWDDISHNFIVANYASQVGAELSRCRCS